MPSNPAQPTPHKPVKEKNTHGVGVTIFSAIILVIIVVTFIGAPVVSNAAGETTYTFGTYDGVPIEFAQGNTFSQQVEQMNRFYEQFNQGNSNMELQRQLVWRQAFEQTAVQVGLKREAEKAGIVVTDAKIDRELVNHSAYQRDGKFSEEAYRVTSSAERFRYRKDTESQLLIEQYAQDRVQGAMLSTATKEFIAGMEYPQRKFSFVTFTDADYPQSLVAEYAAQNKGLFRTVDVSRITVTSSEGDANKVRDEAVKGEKAFADLAKTYSKDSLAESGGAMGVRYVYELKSEITKADDLDKLLALTKGAISSVIKGEKSWTIYKMNTPATDADLSSSDTLAVVRAYITQNERGLLEDNLEAQAKSFSDEASKGFDGAAKKLGKTVVTSKWVSLNFGNHDLFPSMTEASDDQTFRGLASNDDFFKKAFRLERGQVSAPILASPAVLVVRLDDVKTAPEANETAVSADAVESSNLSERNSELRKAILSPPKFQDQFQTTFNRLFQ